MRSFFKIGSNIKMSLIVACEFSLKIKVNYNEFLIFKNEMTYTILILSYKFCNSHNFIPKSPLGACAPYESSFYGKALKDAYYFSYTCCICRF